MSYTEKDFKEFQENELKPDDTFHFECKMCGNCCRNRSEPIVLTGVDLFLIASYLKITMQEAISRYTEYNLGSRSHIPVLTLRERIDGSCSLLRNGRCIVQESKPIVCALFPLGRYYDLRDHAFHYFMNPKACKRGEKTSDGYTLQQWLDKFRIKETEEMCVAWNQLVTGLVNTFSRINKDSLSGQMMGALFYALYLGYEPDEPYIPQVKACMGAIKDILKEDFGLDVRFK